MKHILLILIKLYWVIIPKSKRRKCIFNKSCSKYVYEITAEKGFLEGYRAFIFRFNNCRAGFEIFKNPVNNKIQMILPSKVVIDTDEIADRFLTK